MFLYGKIRGLWHQTPQGVRYDIGSMLKCLSLKNLQKVSAEEVMKQVNKHRTCCYCSRVFFSGFRLYKLHSLSIPVEVDFLSSSEFCLVGVGFPSKIVDIVIQVAQRSMGCF